MHAIIVPSQIHFFDRDLTWLNQPMTICTQSKYLSMIMLDVKNLEKLCLEKQKNQWEEEINSSSSRSARRLFRFLSIHVLIANL
jgi:hypothetical protein